MLQQSRRTEQRARRRPRTPVEETCALARSWAPYGGPPDEEIFVRFGWTKATFDG
ncbi:hypothetical protein Pd630_LPD17022 (plasmid) [Rhodococcus opacus PD630]|nr:hypothetical protein Pd630_LPD17022 [Rhodococcus opacus PD630]